jgi:FSR family fosmidomycin resistance protein-like MFS transporter
MSLLRNPTLIAATLGHFSVDMYSGMLPLVLLALTDPLGLSYSQVGLVSMAFTVASSVSQPLFGWIGDRRSTRLMAVLGVAAIAVTMGVMRFAGAFAVLMVLAPLAGLGSGAFHPQGAVLAARTTPEQRGSAMSIYMMGGNTGYAFGPIFGNAVFAFAGGFMPEMIALVGLGQAALVYWALAGQHAAHAASSRTIITATKRAATSVIVLLMLVIFFRSWVQTSITTFVPQVFKAEGYTTAFAGNVLFSILMPLAIGGLLGGTLSDRIGRRRVLIVSTGLMGPALWGLLNSSGPAAFAWGAILGITSGASMPVTLVMAQALIPRGLGMMSGVVLGFTFIAGAVGVSANGISADHVGLMPTMLTNAALPLLASGLAFLLPDDRPGLQVEELSDPGISSFGD